MRVIAGSARHLQLKTLEGLDTRPTTDRMKETLFNMINPYLVGANFLDLYSGSGSIGIEALSRGAQRAVFVEKSRAALECIKRNLDTTKLTKNAILYPFDVFQALKSLDSKKEVYDIIFMDPPYDHEYEKDVIEFLKDSSLVNEDTIIIVEASIDTNFEYLKDNIFEIYKTKKYKTNKHVFIHKNKERI